MKKEKYLQIFNYLLEFSKLRSKPIRDIEASSNYPEVVWMSNIPKDEKVDCIIHDTYSNESNYWLKISKPEEPVAPIFPRPPKNIEEWIISSSLLNKNELPELFPEIVNKEGEIIYLKDNPEVLKFFEKYCEEKWIYESASYWKRKDSYDLNYSEYEKVNNIYKKLFSIYNKSQQFGEEYELIMGVGLIDYTDKVSGKTIRRHAFTTPIEIHFEYSKRDSSIIVSQNIDNGLQIETDSIIDLFDSFDSKDILEAEIKAKEYIKEKDLVNPFEPDIHDVIQLFAERIKPGDSKYIESLNKPELTTNKPTLFFAPAIILRKRDSKSFTSLYENIINDIKGTDDIDIPPLNDLVESDNSIKKSSEKVFNSELGDNVRIYFPNKYNEEQKTIIVKARTNDKVLVQGPPGTGKSHTIANLICHLLASGKKVLVTAYTKRALEVLKDKLPEEFKSLAVNFLSGDSSSIKDLEVSINRVNEKLSNSDIDSLQKEIDYHENLLEEIIESRQHDKDELFIVKEEASLPIEINPEYKGTITEIARKLEAEKNIHSWYEDEFIDYSDNESIDNLIEFIKLFEQFGSVNPSEFRFSLPSLEKLFTIHELKDYSHLNSLVEKENLSYLNTPKIHYKYYDHLRNNLIELRKVFERAELISHPFYLKILSDWSTLNTFQWNDKIEKSKSILDELSSHNLKHNDRNIEIHYPENKSLISLKNDANCLLNFINSGNTLSGIGFKLKKAFLSTEIKEKLYFIDQVKVNGSFCDTADEFVKVIDDLSIKQCFDELSILWDYKYTSKYYDEKLKSYQKLSDDTFKLLEFLVIAKKIIDQIQSQSTIRIEAYNIQEIDKLIINLEINETLNQLNYFKSKREEVSVYLSKEGLHPISGHLLQAISNLSVDKYIASITEVSRIESVFQKYNKYKELDCKLSVVFPSLVKMIVDKEFSVIDIPKLKAAIYYKHSLGSIKQVLSTNKEGELIEKIKSYDEREEKLVSKIASAKAWINVLSNLSSNPNLRRHLEAWIQAIKRIGKTGTGKRALKFRKIAQEEMEHCKTSIPCWIMPLYKVAETIKPEQGIYDYAIIDEASQLGPDAIFLLYIAKNIIIVGDDKQTSPEYIGVDANAMTPFIEKHLQGIPFKNFYGTEYSFFDHAKRFCDGITVLREHFRCMPEIIEFSNKLFYAPEGNSLYPLKQYSENRLEPLMHVYCPEGYSEGQSSSIRNENEAKAISNKVNEIVNDKRYDGKTIGIICLQGNAQSVIIETMLLKNIGETEFKKRKIICGNSASFQGDERDIILLSLVTARNHNRSALTRAEDERRFNVAVSRAIEQIWLFHSIQIEDLSNLNDLRYKLLDHFVNYKPVKPPMPIVLDVRPNSNIEPFESQLEIEVFNNIVLNGYSVKPKYEVVKGKYQIDMVVYSPNGTKIAIECSDDRWHGQDKFYNHIQKNKVLERCGWQFFKLRGGDYYINREESLEPLWNLLKVHEEIEEITSEITNSPFTEGVSTLLDNREEPITILDIDDSEAENTFYLEQNTGDINQSSSSGNIIRYFNLFESGTYVLTEETPLKADYILPISANQKNGFLLQCYDSGHVNKVYISTLLKKRIGKEYMNGINPENRLVHLTIIEDEKILGVFFSENGEAKFKAHYTEKISNRDALHLQGYKIMYSDYDNIEYKILPMSIGDHIKRLIFNSFTASGKVMSNPYYNKEWEILKEFYKELNKY
ncbi:AAA domain-containing protein [Bacteroidales bacterium MB20-C3-3]|nr:AAA domain-containing protein [Bacteroidales bacterium MB20-C3-3]